MTDVSISFIITTFNIAPYIQQCLESLRPCVRPGDQVILVDDGSTDETETIVRHFLDDTGFGPGVRVDPIWLGVNTIGGVGIPGNIGLDLVECDTVFFVDGDDYLIPEAFLRVRRDYEAHPTDIHFADYLEFDQKAGRTKPPADARKWNALDRPLDPEALRLAAIGLIAVPWRKFYRADFLRRHGIRFPEGPFFFEDNPFHWQVCTLADSIGFSRVVICHHRVNRPGQTMASTGVELAAFFTHFETILATLPKDRQDLRLQAGRWLIGNMSWHIPRLQPAAFFAYAGRAQEALRRIQGEDWQELEREMSATGTWHQAARLREPDGVWDIVGLWRGNADRALLSRIERETKGLEKRLRDLDKRIRGLETQAKVTREIAQSQQAIEEFAVLQSLIGPEASG